MYMSRPRYVYITTKHTVAYNKTIHINLTNNYVYFWTELDSHNSYYLEMRVSVIIICQLLLTTNSDVAVTADNHE